MTWLGVNDATSAAAATTLVVPTPGGTAPPQNSIILIHGSWGSNGVTFSIPGFSAVPGLSNLAYIGAAGTGFVLYKVAGASEPTSNTVTASVSDLGACQCNIFGGRNTASPFTAVSTSAPQFNGSPLLISCASVASGNGDDLIFLDCIGNNVSNTSPTLTAPSGFSNVRNTFSSVANCPSANSATKQNVSGASGVVTGSVAFSGGANNDAGGYLISLSSGVIIIPAQYPLESVEYF